MSMRRLLCTATVMAAIAVTLSVLTPSWSAMTGAITTAQRTVDAHGSDALVTAAAGLLAWAVWAWGALGLVLTAASALPGIAGAGARLTLRVALPAGARHGAAVLLGVGLGIAAPLAGAGLPALAPTAWAASPPGGEVPDWPTPTAAAPVPDWPADAGSATPELPAAGQRVVVRGDCLWHIAADSLLGLSGRLPADGEVAAAVQAWWQANADVIGPDPDLLLPGQVLRAPGPA
jgi:nucleoid-associated protein YgaU